MAATRPAAVAGRFYPADADSCGQMLAEMFHKLGGPPALAAIVPHAGWIYSGRAAAMAWSSIGAAQPETVVIFGAVHASDRNDASVFAEGSWETPLGTVEIDAGLASRFVRCPQVSASSSAHAAEHSIEVQLPLLQYVLPASRFVPIAVRPGPHASEIGRGCARAAAATGRKVAYVGSTDLTHYGPAFGFQTHGHGEEGARWAKDVNDRRFIALIQAMDAEGVVEEAAERRNACGSGAVAATIAAAREIGATQYRELCHTCSAEVRTFGDADASNSVGYEAGVFLPPGQ